MCENARAAPPPEVAFPNDEMLNVTHALTARQRPLRHGSLPIARAWKRRLTQLSLAIAAFGLVNLGGADALRALPDASSGKPKPEAAAKALSQAPAMIWTIDADGDGVADFSNPTHRLVRGVDAFGSGDFLARRDGGKRKHHGVDYIAAVGQSVRAPISGEVSRLGYAYGGDGGYRVIEIANSETKHTARVLYAAPSVKVGDVVVAGQEIGVAQDLSKRYPGITNHVHVELRDARQRLLDATEQLPSTALWVQRADASSRAL
jgi:murein DD-endopeptidase MepM/ murein hydrolase activator NlpD